jgi:radical SAM superfamily enzyme YgiQ (UPF0313 family)
MKKKLLLINPIDKSRPYLKLIHQPLSLGIIANLTPSDWDIEIIDENFDHFQFIKADLVALTSFTKHINRAYEIAAIYRKNNIHTVLGGIHATLLPDEAVHFVDIVAIGNAEDIWCEILKDFENGTVKKIYNSHKLNIGTANHTFFNNKYSVASIETSRGCKLNCEFCSVSKIYNKKYIQKPINEVLDEIQKVSQKEIFFVDDNLIGFNEEDRNRALGLFKGMIERKLNKRWVTQTSIKFAFDEEILKYAKQSGCFMIFIGLESENMSCLKEMRKQFNFNKGVTSYFDAIKNIHKYRIAIKAGFIFGFDNDTEEIIKQRTKFLIENPFDAFQLTLLTPFPGTDLYTKFFNENRLVLTNYPSDWVYYDWKKVVFSPKNIDAEQLEKVFFESAREIYSFKNSLIRFFITLKNIKNVHLSLELLALNIIYRNSYK